MGKTTCKVFTPLEIVNQMLDKIGYTDDLQGKKFLENSCGTGRFLCETVKRYITDARSHKINDSQIIEGLEKDLRGIEKEQQVLEQCVKNLDETAAAFGLTGIQWNIEQGDALDKEIPPIYDFVAGNPPYITYYNLEEEDRNLIRSKYDVCRKGKADYYYAFTEAAVKALKPGGRLAYLIPNNFMKNRFSEELRLFLLPHLTELNDFRDKKIFDSYLTSSAVIVCRKDSAAAHFQYNDIPNNRQLRITKDEVSGKWAFYLSRRSHSSVRFGDCFQVAAPVATLLNEAFVLFDVTVESEKYILHNNHYIEKAVVRKAASPKTLQKPDKKTYIIFPYCYINGKRISYQAADFKERFPQAYAYLMEFEVKLKKRKSDSRSKWFEYGRSQALDHINQEKIILSTLITDRIRYYRADEDTVPFSGMFIIPREGRRLEEAEEILKSGDFLAYVKEIGISVSGSSYRISPQDVKNYVIEGSCKG